MILRRQNGRAQVARFRPVLRVPMDRSAEPEMENRRVNAKDPARIAAVEAHRVRVEKMMAAGA